MNLPYMTIRYWGSLMGSHQYYVNDQVTEAIADDAPAMALYKRRHDSGQWQTLDQVTNLVTLEEVLRLAERAGDSETIALCESVLRQLSAK